MKGAERLGRLLGNIQNAARNQLIGLPDDAPHPTLLLSVDQAEELFSADATEEARAFLELIGDVLRTSSAPHKPTRSFGNHRLHHPLRPLRASANRT